MFDDMITDMESNKKLGPIITEMILRGRKLNIKCYTLFYHENFNKRDLQQIASKHSSDIDIYRFYMNIKRY